MRIHLLGQSSRRDQAPLPDANFQEYLRDSDFNLAQQAFWVDQSHDENLQLPALDDGIINSPILFGEESQRDGLNEGDDDQA